MLHCIIHHDQDANIGRRIGLPCSDNYAKCVIRSGQLNLRCGRSSLAEQDLVVGTVDVATSGSDQKKVVLKQSNLLIPATLVFNYCETLRKHHHLYHDTSRMIPKEFPPQISSFLWLILNFSYIGIIAAFCRIFSLLEDMPRKATTNSGSFVWWNGCPARRQVKHQTK